MKKNTHKWANSSQFFMILPPILKCILGGHDGLKNVDFVGQLTTFTAGINYELSRLLEPILPWKLEHCSSVSLLSCELWGDCTILGWLQVQPVQDLGSRHRVTDTSRSAEWSDVLTKKSPAFCLKSPNLSPQLILSSFQTQKCLHQSNVSKTKTPTSKTF